MLRIIISGPTNAWKTTIAGEIAELLLKSNDKRPAMKVSVIDPDFVGLPMWHDTQVVIETVQTKRG